MWYELIFYVFIAGSVGGFIAGLLGLGGGVVMVPCLAAIYHLLEFPPEYLMHFAIGSSLAAMISSTFFSAVTHASLGAKIWEIYRFLVGGVIVGTVIGALIADLIDTRTLAILFGIFLWIVAIRMFFSLNHHEGVKKPIAFVVSFVIGGVSSLLGVGGGIVTVPYLTHRGVSIRDALGISAAFSVTIAIVGTLSYIVNGLNEPGLPPWSSGFVYWPAVLGIAVLSPFFSWLGAKTSHRLPVPTLKKIFAIAMAIIGTQMIFLTS